MVALGRGELNAAAALIRDSSSDLRQLYYEAQQVDRQSDYREFGETLDIVLHAGLVAQAQDNWQMAVRCFQFVRGMGSYRPP